MLRISHAQAKLALNDGCGAIAAAMSSVAGRHWASNHSKTGTFHGLA
jgi:hypothetical protein